MKLHESDPHVSAETAAGSFRFPLVLPSELSVNTAQFAKSAAMLGNSEDHTALSRALSQLAEVEEKIDQLHQDQASADFYLFSELLGDYVRLITAVKVGSAGPAAGTRRCFTV